jgi:hypothetical protein
MSNFLLGGAMDTVDLKITGNTALTVFTAKKRTVITSIICTENNGGTPNLTIARWDGTNTYFIRNALAVTAKQSVIFNEPMVLKAGWELRVTSSDAAGHFDVMVTYLLPDATALGAWSPQG